MLSIQEKALFKKRRELMDELIALNKGDGLFDRITQMKEHEEKIKKIEKRVLRFFKGGVIDYKGFDYYRFQLGDLLQNDKYVQLALYNEKTGKKIDEIAYVYRNVYVEYATKFFKKICWEVNNRKGVDEELGHYQRNVRKGFFQLENKIGTGERKRIVMLYPDLTYNNTLSIKEIQAIWDVARSTATEHLKKLTSDEYGKVLLTKKEGRKTVYYFNPKYVFMGTSKKKKEYDVKVYFTFLKNIIEKVAVLESELAMKMEVKELAHSALATLHAIIPYFHYERCYAVKNPTHRTTLEDETVWEATRRERREGTSSGLEYLTINDIANILSKNENDPRMILRDLEILERADAIVYTNNTILINPKLMWAMSDELNNSNNLYIEHIEETFHREKEAREQKGDKEWSKKFVEIAEKNKVRKQKRNE
jgi:DNA-binding transcriptional ArsR family regulator